MKIYLTTLSIFVTAFFITSCNKKTYFTSEIRNSIESRNIDLKKLQYFIDNDVVFRRDINSDTARIAGGNIVFQNGSYFETVTLKANTKGICTAVYPNRLNIAFETGDNKYITFAIPKSMGNSNVYQMINEDRYGNETNAIKYDNMAYNLVVKHDYLPRLMIRKRLIEKEDRIDRIMKGRKVK